MPEAVKEVVAEVSQAALKENAPDKLPCKDVKPAEASSGTLPADEETTKDASEGAVAPDLGQGEAPEQGKSESSGDSKDASVDNKNDNPEKEVKENITDKTESDKVNINDGSIKEEKQVDESKEVNSDESISQESKQSSPEECRSEESKQASPEESKTEESMETQTSNDQDSTVKKNANENNLKEESSEKKEGKLEKNEPVEKELKDSKEAEVNKKVESMDMNLEESNRKEEDKAINKVPEKESVAEPIKENSIEPMEEAMGSSNQEKETKEVIKETNIDTLKQETIITSQDPKTSEQESLAENKSDKAGENENVKQGGTSKIEQVSNESTSEEQKLQSESMPISEEKMEEDKINAESSQENLSSLAINQSVKGNESSVEKSDCDVTSAKSADSSENSSGLQGCHTTENKESGKKMDVPLENGNADGSGSSKEVDAESAEEIQRQLREGKGLLATGDYFTAADILGKACEAAGKLYGDLANENAELYYFYGCSMLECAKNENNVLGEGVKEKDDEEGASEDTPETEVNGDEQMETEENGDGDEEKMAVDADENTKDEETADNTTEKDDSEQVNSENGLDDETKTTKENSDEEEDSSLKVAWEMFELAKIAFTRMGNEDRLADTYIKLAEVGLESGNQSALDDMKAALELRKKCSTANPRLISETHFTLGLGFATFEMFDEAIEQFKLSKSLLEAKIDSLLKVEEGKAKEEIKDIKELLPDLEEKIQDMQESKDTKLKQVQNGETSSVEKTEVSKPVSNITHLIKRKRKLEDVASDLLPNTKQPCTENIVESKESKK